MEGFGYQYGVNEIEKICAIYGNGIGAIGSRALKIEDINQITGYNPEDIGDGRVFKEGEIGEYQNKVTYTRNTNATTKAEGENGVNTTYNYTAFNYFDQNNNKWKNLDVGESTTITNTYYCYDPTKLTNGSSDSQKGIASNSKEYSMLFSNNKSYWLASRYEGGFDTSITCTWGIFNVGLGIVRGARDNYLMYWGGNQKTLTKGIMPVVSLSSNIQLEKLNSQKNGCTEWEIESN